MFRELFVWVQKYERHLSAVAMVAGFIVDSIFFERVDMWQTQFVFISYAIICFVSIPLLHFIEARAERGIPRPKWRSILPIATQFALGGFWSGFFVFYGRSAVLSASWPFLLLLVVVLIGNEFYSRYHGRLVFTSVLFFLAIYSYSIFTVPIYTHSIGTITFIESGVVAIILFALFTSLLRILGNLRFNTDVWRIRVGATVVLILINVFYFTDVLPPLPLSTEAAGVYHSVWREPGTYFATTESSPWYVQYLGVSPTIHVVDGESLYAYSAIFAPIALKTSIIHKWQIYDEATNKWTTKASVKYPILGGRDGGYRGYSAVLADTYGKWRVRIETDDGRLLQQLNFKITKVSLPPATETITLK